MSAAAAPFLRNPLRISGQLLADAHLGYTVGYAPCALLTLSFAADKGLPYSARIDLGSDVADHMAAAQLLVDLRAGQWVSVAADGLQVQSDHGQQLLRLINPRDALALGDGPDRPARQTPALLQARLPLEQPTAGDTSHA